MRKSFTLLFSTLILLCAFGFSSFAAAPQLAGTDPLSPANLATNVKPSVTDLVVKFNQNVKFTATGGTLTILKGTSLVKTITLATGNANAVIKDNTLTVKHGLTLTDLSEYSIGITNNAIENAAGEKFAGINSADWKFTTGDYTAPVVKTLTPLNGATGVDVKTNPFNLVVEFTDVNNIKAVDGKKVWLYKEDGTIVDIVVLAAGTNVTVSGKIATITISNNAYRSEYTKYYVNIEAGAFVDVSTNENKFAGIMNNTTWTFSSQDYSAAYIVTKSVDDITGTSGKLNVVLNEKGHVYYRIQLASVAIPDHPSVDASIWTKVATNDAKAMTANLTSLVSGSEYTVYLVAENLMGNMQSTITDLDFTTLDVTAPTANNNREVKVSNVTVGVKLDFNERVVAGTGDLLIKQQDNNATVRTVAAADVEIMKPEGSLVWVMTASFEGLPSSVGYYVIIPDGFVKDVAGNNYVSTFKTTTAWMFTSGDFVKPTVAVKILASTPPAATNNIEIKFSEPVKLIGATTIESVSGGDENAWFNYITLEKNNVIVPFTATYAGGTIIVDPAGPLSPNSTYIVKIRANAFEDLAGNKFSDVHTAYTLVTGDFGAAEITYLPADAATAVAKGTQPKITFAKEAKVKPGTAAAVAITPENLKPLITFKKTNSSGDNVAFSVTWDAATRTAVLVPDAELASSQVYYVAIDYTKIVDAYGTVFANPGTATFTMVDYVAPTVAFSHKGTVTDLAASADLTLTFSETVTLSDADVAKLVVFKQTNADGVNLPFVATWDAGTKKITINPNADLEDGKVYYYGVGAGVAKDAANNSNAASFTAFTFAPAVPDMLEVAEGGYVPAINAVNVKLNTSNQLVASLTFTEAIKPNPVMPANHSAYLYQEGNATAIATVEILATYFAGNKLTMTFTPVLVSEGKYYITLDPNVVVANADNNKAFAGIAANVWKFTSADVIKPELTINTPLNDATGVALDAAVKLTANEKVVAGTGNITITGTGDTKTIAVADVVINNDATPVTITIPHAAFTQYAIVYTVSVPAGAFKDMAGNTSDAVGPWSFTTISNPPPAVVTLSPADEQDMVAAGTESFVITFSEEVQKGASGTVAFLFEKGTGATRALLNGDGTASANSDIQRGAVLVSSSNVQVAGNVVTLNFEGFKLVDGKEYFILVENGMFKDKSQPATANFTGLSTYGEWNFYTKDVNVPTWAVTYVKRGTGMDITSDIVITFSKPIEKAAGGEISSADVATLFDLSVGGTTIAFTGNINAEKTVVVLENASFIPALTTGNSGQLVSVAPKTTSIRGKVNQGAVSTTAVTFNVADYVAPVATLTPGAIEGEKLNFNVSSNEDGKLYWVVQKGTGTLTAAEVKAAGIVIADYVAGVVKAITVDTDVVSETKYTVFAVAEDKTGNLSIVAKIEITTADITKPVLVSKSADFIIPVTGGVYSATGTLYLKFSEKVIPNGALAVIRKADTHEIVDSNVALVAHGTTEDSLKIVFNVASFSDTQKFIIEIAGGQVIDKATPANSWNGQIGLGANAWTVGLRDRTAPTLTLSAITPEYNSTTMVYVKPVAVDGNFTLTFNENVKLADNASFLVKYYEFDGQPYNADNWKAFELLERNRITISGNKVTIDPVRLFWPREDGTLSAVSYQYELVVSAGSILDIAGNAYAPSFTGLFNIVDNKAPVATFLPANNATGVSQTGNLTISFNEALVLADGTVVDMYDLETMVYLKKGGEVVAHLATIDAAKKVITIDPAASLEKGAVYTYGFTAGFKDAAGNAVAAKEVSFTVITDAMVAALITFDPDNKIVDQPTVVPVDQTFRIIFNGELYAYSTVNSENNIAVTPSWLQGSITLKQGDTNVPFTAAVESRTADKTVVVVTANAALLSETAYVLSVVGNKLQLGVGNQTILETGRSNNYYTTDVLAPLALSFVPANTTTVAKSTTMTIQFNEKVMPGVGQVKIYHKHGELKMTVDAADLKNAAGTNGPWIIEVGKLTSLEADEYYVIIPSGVITDLAGNPWKGVTVEDEWHFFVNEDLAQPVITDIAPVGGNTPVNTRLTITFDRPVVLNPNHVGFIAIYNANGIAFQLIRVNDGAANITFNGDKTIATININTLAENTRYLVEVEAGTFVSQADPTLANAGVVRSIWSFTTEINTPPAVLLLTPADNATNVSLRTVAKMGFNQDVKAGTGVITLRRGVDGTVVHSFDVNSSAVKFEGKTVSFDISSYLEANATAYYIIVPKTAISNTSFTPEYFAGLEQTTSWNFTTQGDGAKPELVTWSPDEVEIANNHPVFVMEFNEAVKLVKPVKLIVTKVGETTPALEIPLTEAMFNGSTVTVSYEERISGVLEYSTEYFVTISGGAIEDLWENVWDGVSDKTVWTFKTKDVNTTIAQIQGTGNVSPMVNQVVHVTGTVTGISAGEGFFIQDANAAWSGIWVAYGTTASLKIGDGVYVFGTVAEVSEVTTVNASSVKMVNAPVVVAPVVVASPSAAKAEMYESVLVQVDGARANAANSSGVWTIYYEAASMVAVNKWMYTYTPVAGNFYNVAGIVNGRLSDYKLEPRMASDITDLTATNAPVVSAVDFKVYPNPFNDRISIDNHDKLTRVVITNIAGQKVMDVQFPEREIRTANLISGVYVISLFTEDGMVKSDRIVKR
jgi:large repetitive protein